MINYDNLSLDFYGDRIEFLNKLLDNLAEEYDLEDEKEKILLRDIKLDIQSLTDELLSTPKHIKEDEKSDSNEFDKFLNQTELDMKALFNSLEKLSESIDINRKKMQTYFNKIQRKINFYRDVIEFEDETDSDQIYEDYTQLNDIVFDRTMVKDSKLQLKPSLNVGYDKRPKINAYGDSEVDISDKYIYILGLNDKEDIIYSGEKYSGFIFELYFTFSSIIAHPEIYFNILSNAPLKLLDVKYRNNNYNPWNVIEENKIFTNKFEYTLQKSCRYIKFVFNSTLPKRIIRKSKEVDTDVFKNISENVDKAIENLYPKEIEKNRVHEIYLNNIKTESSQFHPYQVGNYKKTHKIGAERKKNFAGFSIKTSEETPGLSNIDYSIELDEFNVPIFPENKSKFSEKIDFFNINETDIYWFSTTYPIDFSKHLFIYRNDNMTDIEPTGGVGLLSKITADVDTSKHFVIEYNVSNDYYLLYAKLLDKMGDKYLKITDSYDDNFPILLDRENYLNWRAQNDIFGARLDYISSENAWKLNIDKIYDFINSIAYVSNYKISTSEVRMHSIEHPETEAFTTETNLL